MPSNAKRWMAYGDFPSCNNLHIDEVELPVIPEDLARRMPAVVIIEQEQVEVPVVVEVDEMADPAVAEIVDGRQGHVGKSLAAFVEVVAEQLIGLPEMPQEVDVEVSIPVDISHRHAIAPVLLNDLHVGRFEGEEEPCVIGGQIQATRSGHVREGGIGGSCHHVCHHEAESGPHDHALLRVGLTNACGDGAMAAEEQMR